MNHNVSHWQQVTAILQKSWAHVKVMSIFSPPRSFRLNNAFSATAAPVHWGTSQQFAVAPNPIAVMNDHQSHPAIPRLILLVCEAILEVVVVSAPGYIVARQGMFDAEMQKFAANLNVMLFTPCLSR